jgi:DNA-binding CsgD family transcriptional regulator/tetratricopeptide (TPR) repeat protein
MGNPVTPPESSTQPVGPDIAALLLRGRTCFERQEWNDAFEALSLADRLSPLNADDLSRLSWSAGLAAKDEDMLATHERLYHLHMEAGGDLAAGRVAFWLGFRLLARGEPARASGWLSRAQRLIEPHGDCVEQGYLLLPMSQKHLSAGELTEAGDCAARARLIGERFGERDLVAFALNLQGRVLLADARVEQGLALLDEAMVAATCGELSPLVTGIVYCSSIASCHRVFALDRVREWTTALSSWCSAHPQLGLFTGHCLVHRAEVFEMSGAWPEAADEARRAIERCVRNIEREAAGRAHYQGAEIQRLRGEFDFAEAAYREASRLGFEPQPGLALLRLAQGDENAAASASRRMVAATRDRFLRTRFLPAHVDIMLAVGDPEEASAASRELEETAACLMTEVLAALAARARASIRLAEGNSGSAIEPARHAFAIWQKLGAPYLAARVRVLIARAYTALGDVEGAQLELACARETFEALGAKPDLAIAEALGRSPGAGGRGGTQAADCRLTDRELQVLRLVASGKTNKGIARELELSEKTVDRHVSNIFAKVSVSSRAAATAFAYERKLI